LTAFLPVWEAFLSFLPLIVTTVFLLSILEDNGLYGPGGLCDGQADAQNRAVGRSIVRCFWDLAVPSPQLWTLPTSVLNRDARRMTILLTAV
jgi:hypothetical protein